MTARVLLNQVGDEVGLHGYAPPSRAPLAFHRRLAGYAPTPLIAAPTVAERLGVGTVWVKDESARLGLPSFKVLGASWATWCTLRELVGAPDDVEVDGLRARLADHPSLTLVAATDGNHGRAVARMAALFGLDARIFVPDDMVAARRDAIAGEGATVTVVDGTYDDAVRAAAATADDRHVVISDTSWEGYTDVPRMVVEGYSTIFWEVTDQLADRDAPPPDVVAVQMGVGALATATVRYARVGRTGSSVAGSGAARVVGVEPTSAACVLAAVAAGRRVEVPGPHDSIMSGLNCGLVSPLALPVLADGIAVFVAVDDDHARYAMRMLATAGVTSGESGSAGLAGLLGALDGPAADAVRQVAGLTPDASVLLISTEGATDPDAYRAVVGAAPGSRRR